MTTSRFFPLFALTGLGRKLAALAACTIGLVGFAPQIFAQPNGGSSTVIYSPTIQAIQGTIPFGSSYVLTIGAPSTLTGPATVTFSTDVASSPSGVTSATALSYVKFSPTSLTFAGPSDVKTVTVTMAVPANAVAGAYGYTVFTTGWPATAGDNFGSSITATVSPSATGVAPSVVISTPTDLQNFSFAPTAFPAQIPLSFTATATASHPIISVDANFSGPSFNGTAVAVTPTSTNGNATVTATGNMAVTAPGSYSVQVRGTNDVGTSASANSYTVTVAGLPPVVAITTPTPNQSFTLTSGTPLTTQLKFGATSPFGALSALSATVNGNAVSFTPSGLGSLSASGLVSSYALTAVGSYTMVVTATNPYGSASTSVTFNVVSSTPPTPKLTLSISQPTATTITRVAGSPATVVPFSFVATETNGTVSTLAATLKAGSASAVSQTVTKSGLNTGTATGTGNLSISAAGTYIFTASATGTGSLTASQAVTIVVKETQPAPQPCTTKVLWLAPVSDCRVQKGGCATSVAFQLQQCCPVVNTGGSHNNCDDDDDDDDNSWGHGDRHNHRDCNENDYGDHSYGDCPVSNTTCTYVKDTTVVVSIYEIYSNGSTGSPKFFTYTTGTIGTTHYTISGSNSYKLAYTTGSGKHRYHVEIDSFANGANTPTLLGTHEFTTQ